MIVSTIQKCSNYNHNTLVKRAITLPNHGNNNLLNNPKRDITIPLQKPTTNIPIHGKTQINKRNKKDIT